LFLKTIGRSQRAIIFKILKAQYYTLYALSLQRAVRYELTLIIKDLKAQLSYGTVSINVK